MWPPGQAVSSGGEISAPQSAHAGRGREKKGTLFAGCAALVV